MEGGLSRSNSFTDFASTSSFPGKKNVCRCSLDAVLRTSLTYQNMGRRFWGCPKFEVGKVGKAGNACDFFHFLDGDEMIERRVRDLLLRLKDKQIRLEKEIQSYKKGNKNLMAEKGKLLQENADLMSKNGKFLQENGELKVQCEAFVKNIKGLEKKVKRSEKICVRALISCQIFCVVCIVCLLVSVFLFLCLLGCIDCINIVGKTGKMTGWETRIGD